MTTERLAIDGGTPVIDRPLPAGKGLAVFGPEEKAAVLDVLERRSLFRYYGPDLAGTVAAFEAAACQALRTPHAVATSSGTAALRTALAALGVGCGDEVILPCFTFIASVNAVVVAGAVPVFAEVDDSLGLDPVDLEVKVSPRTAAVIPVHLENVACDMDGILAVTQPRGLPVLEDTAQSMGATYRGRPLGSIGDLGAFSLQLEKNVTSGEGGLVVTADDRLFLRAARYQDQGGQFVTSHGGGRGDDLDEPFVGENLRMTEIAGAIAGVQLARLPDLLAAMRTSKRRILAQLGERAGGGSGSWDGLTLRGLHDPDGDGGSSITWFLPDAPTAKRFAAALRAEGVPAGQFYGGRPVYTNPAILERRTATGKGGPWHCAEHPTDIRYFPGLCPRSEALVARNVTIGVGARYTAQDCDDVAAAVAKVAGALLPA